MQKSDIVRHGDGTVDWAATRASEEAKLQTAYRAGRLTEARYCFLLAGVDKQIARLQVLLRAETMRARRG